MIGAPWPSMVTETPPREVATKPPTMDMVAGLAGPMLVPQMVTNCPGLSGPAALVALLKMPRIVGVLATLIDMAAESPPGAGFSAMMFNAPAASSAVDGTTAFRIVELITVVVSAVL